MTDSRDPNRRRRPHREPATLDLKATVLNDGRKPAGPVPDNPAPDTPAPDTPAPNPSAGPAGDAPGREASAGPSPLGEAPAMPADATVHPAPEAEPATHSSAEAEPASPGAGVISAGETISEPVHGASWPGTGEETRPGGTTDDRASEPPSRRGLPPLVSSAESLTPLTSDATHGTAEPSAERLAAGESPPVEPTVPISDSDFTRGGGPVPPAGGSSDRAGSMPPGGAAAPVRPERRSAGFGSLLTAGILGGLVGAGALYGLQTLRPVQAPNDPRIAEIQHRLAALPRGDAAQGLERRIGAVEAAQGDVAQRLAAAQSLAERAAARAEEAANRPAPAPNVTPGIAPAADAPGAAAAAPAADPAALEALTGRLAALEEQVRNPPAVAELTSRFGALEEQVRNPPAVAELATRLGTIEGQTGQRIEANAGATQALERQVAEAATARQTLDRRLGETDQRVGDVQRQLQQWSPQAVQAGLRTVLAGRLNEALAQGAPFADVLGGLRRFEADPARLQALEPVAATGAPTAAALQQEFRPLAERIVRETRGEADTITERLLRMADRVVTVRAVDDPGSNAVPAVVARIEGALARGALADAAAAWDSLPEQARQVSAAWGQRLRARVAADGAARAIAADSVAALNAAPR